MTWAYLNLPMHTNLMTNFSISNQYCVINSNTDVTTNASKKFFQEYLDGKFKKQKIILKIETQSAFNWDKL